MLFFVGLFLAMVGFAMIVVGAFPWPGRRRISSRGSRLAGSIFLSFFPLFFLARLIIIDFELEKHFHPMAAYWGLAALCAGVGLTVVFRAAAPTASRSTSRTQESTKSLNAPPKPSVPPSPKPRQKITPTSAPKSKPQEETPSLIKQDSPPSPRKSKPGEKDPFDFS
jgi:outer membrane biosynthesis protein TonB